ncbi:MAG: hypothetical protein U0837_09510 [Dehalococcoidia bacterium]
MSSANLLNPRKPAAWLIALGVGAALFASGALAARATLDDDEPSPAPANSPNTIAPGIGTEAVAPGSGSAAYGPNDVITNDGRGGMDMSHPGCQAPFPAGVIANGVIDPSKAGFVPAFPASGFTPLSVGLAAQGDCTNGESASSGDLVVNSTWQHDATTLIAYITQRATATKVASVFRGDGASFWANGYEFSVSVNPFPQRAIPEGYFAPDDSNSGAGSSSSSGGSTSTAPAQPATAPGVDPAAADVLRELVAQLAPGLDQKCFWTQANGDWNSLAAAGVGDPRPAIPSGYTHTDLNVVALVPPANGCDSSLKPINGFSLNAGWQKGAAAAFSYIGVSVYSDGGNSQPFGQINDYGANWSNGGLSFGVYAKSETPVGRDVILAIAKALDPSFNEACFVQDRELRESDLSALGFHAATAPGGYKLTRSILRAQDIAGGCAKPDGFQPSYSLAWSFQKGADTIEASANRYGDGGSGRSPGYQAANTLNWNGPDGTMYSVNAYSTGVSPTVSKDDLIAVAKSMDPSFDISKLSEGGPDNPIAQPAPAVDPKR